VIPRVRVLVADDHTILREGLVGILRGDPAIEVVGEATDGAETVEKAAKLRPDVLVLDISMPRLNGLEAARRIRESQPSVRILILTMYDDEEYVLKLVRAGVSGYLLKESAASELLAGIHAVREGKSFFGPHAQKALAESCQRELAVPDDPYGSLTNREREVFQLVAEGKTNAQIAELLFISPKTVDNHRTRVMEKLGLHSSSELVRFAARRKLVRYE
jgi:two-component system response regulator NreC